MYAKWVSDAYCMLHPQALGVTEDSHIWSCDHAVYPYMGKCPPPHTPAGGALDAKLSAGPLAMPTARTYLHEMLAAVVYLHSENVLHR